MSQYMLLNMK